MQISVVIPTCNRKERLLSLMGYLNHSTYPIEEVIIVDSGTEKLLPDDYEIFKNLPVIYLESEKSVCIQRNSGIAQAKCPWIFLCDDDIEIPPDYLQKIAAHIINHSEVVAVSGVWLQKENGKWAAEYPVRSTRRLLWNYIFRLSMWGGIHCNDNFISKPIKKFYAGKGNHISKAGWPVLTDFSGEYFTAPIYSLGASMVKKEWLLQFPYDEVLDRHGMGDNYGVAINFPPGSIHVLNNTSVLHHQEPVNRLQRPLQYYRRTLALDYFIKTNKKLTGVKKGWLAWSLVGNLISFIMARDFRMVKVSFKLLGMLLTHSNPYFEASRKKQKIVEPML